MKIFQTADIKPNSPASKTERDWVYNGLDCAVTLEVLRELLPQLNNLSASTYAFSRDLQGPILDMNMRGVLIDIEARDQTVKEYREISFRVQHNLDWILRDGIGTAINWNSPAQLQHLLYDVMGFPPVKFKGKPTVNRDALEKIAANYMYAEPIISHILVLRDIAKKVQTLETRVDSDGRIHTSFNIAGTNTGRLSSSFSEFEESGGNLQNIEQRLRRPFIADPGKKFAYIDLEQAESRAVGAICWNRFHLGTYLDACESGDLHTNVCKMTNPQIAWTNDPRRDKELAEQPFYRQHSYRHMNKVLGHSSNYEGQPHTIAIHTKIAAEVIKEFQRTYFRAFPEIPLWHQDVKNRLREDGFLVSLMGRQRWFFGRRTEAETQRAAIAYDPQGSVGDILNTGLLKVWWSRLCDLLLQVHDAILVQYDEEREDEILPQLLELIKVPVPLEFGRTLVIPSEAKVGWNWAETTPDNPQGLIKYRGHDDRTRADRAKTPILA